MIDENDTIKMNNKICYLAMIRYLIEEDIFLRKIGISIFFYK